MWGRRVVDMVVVSSEHDICNHLCAMKDDGKSVDRQHVGVVPAPRVRQDT